MSLGFYLAQLVSANCTYRIFKQIPDIEGGYGLESNRKWINKPFMELMDTKIIKVEISPDFPESIVYDIYI